MKEVFRPNMFIDFLLCIIGLFALVYAADKLVEGASNLALNFGVSKMMIGLTIVAAGTSLPEFVVSLNSSIKGNSALSLGNVVGSNIMNIALILGITALIMPINSIKAMVKREVPIMIALTALVWVFAKTDSTITPNEGFILLGIFIAYNIMSYIIGKKEAKIAEELTEEAEKIISEKSEEEKPPSMGFNIFCIIGGLIGMVIGSECLVRGAVSIATTLGIGDEVIGLTLVAIGTSLPELATSIVAAKKGQSDLSVGNVVGSNIFNITAIVGTAAVVPFFIRNTASSQFLQVSSDMLSLHIPIMLIVAIVLLPIMFTDMKISRKEGAFFLIIYLAYSIMLVQSATKIKANNQLKTKPIQEQSLETQTPSQSFDLQKNKKE